MMNEYVPEVRTQTGYSCTLNGSVERYENNFKCSFGKGISGKYGVAILHVQKCKKLGKFRKRYEIQ